MKACDNEFLPETAGDVSLAVRAKILKFTTRNTAVSRVKTQNGT